MNINLYLKNKQGRLARVIVCENGLKLSVQASSSHYCTPRNDNGPWSEVEVGSPTRKIEELMPYAENSDDPTGTVYAWVPVEIVDKVISDNGGFSNN